ncbi:MAG TPA: hypothetical protein VHC18_06655 [Amycolatopsis sp.]|nr:hypothetical protein [Amycolatopsis sp.]
MAFEISPLHECPRETREIGYVDALHLQLGRQHEDPGLGRAVTWLDDVVVDHEQPLLIPQMEKLIWPGPPAALVICSMKLAQAWQDPGFYMPLLAAALAELTPMARLAVYDVDPHTDERLAGIEDPAAREAIANDLADALEDSGFADYDGLHVVSLHDPAYRELNTKIIYQWTRPQGWPLRHQPALDWRPAGWQREGYDE